MHKIGTIQGIFLGLLMVLSFTGLLSALLNRWLPKWACSKMGWHLAPTHTGFDGCSRTGVCPRCGQSVLQDSQGNWF